MRKITELAHRAFKNNKKFKLYNTSVLVENEATNMYLFGRHIAKKLGDNIYISDGNYGTSPTTRERLNAFTTVHLRISKGEWILNEKQKWNGDWIRIEDI